MILPVEKGANMNSEEIKAEYTSSLADLTFNSKPLINVLTMLADENLPHAPVIVAAIEEHLAKVHIDVKLPVLYLIDCIAKNIQGRYKTLFSQNIVKTFCNVFKVVDEKTRAEMFKLRQTWNEVFPQKKLYAIDVQINMLDPAWPVTAKPPANSIHFNPKFLKSTPNAIAPNAETAVAPIEPASPNLDTETFTMQQKLIQKQKELIELQQKKLELELLQTQVKLQKQMKTNKTVPNAVPGRPQNILLKPEVAKQLTVAARENSKLKPVGIALNQRAQSVAQTPRIAPVNSALVAAASRPTRDPRLLRQQNDKLNNGTADSSSSVSLGSKTAILDSNKIVTNKMSVRDSRSEPRSVNNIKDNSAPSQTKPDNIKSKPIPKSRQPEQKSIKPRSKSGADSDTKPFSSKSSSSLLDSPSKSKSDKAESKSPSKSPTKHKKKDYGDKKGLKESKRERDIGKSHKSDGALPTNFKGAKGSKNRNYVRRNRSPSYSPEPTQDVDLRVVGPPEKQPRFLPEVPEIKDKPEMPLQGMDVDLRQLPAVVAKKRPSTEALEITAPKKTKTEMFDVLFGNEDTDLRKQLPVVPAERPPTPPPPIISLTENEKEPSKKSNLDAIRAKLANATGRDKIMSQSFRKKRPPQEDEDLRFQPTSPLGGDAMKKIIISSDDEQCIRAGTMTKEQEKQLMNKIIAQIEHQKLKEAQRKDEEANESLQPVSDDELQFNDDAEEKFGDKDERVDFPPKFVREQREPRRGSNYWRGNKRRHWENPHVAPHPRPPIRPWAQPPVNPWRPIGPNFNRPLVPDFPDFKPLELEGRRSPEVPGDLVVDSVNQDDMKTINIDGVPRDIRYYDETAVVFMNWDDPREISFQSGNRRVVFDDKDIYFLSFSEVHKELSIGGELHKVRLGAPSREIFIDGKPYECYFGGPGITIDLNGRMTTVKLDGPPPQVKIGTEKRVDLVAGKVNLIIDAKILVPVFLDAKVQKFVIDGETHTLKFVDALKTVLINDVPFKVEFGGLPKPITVHDKKHFIRFSVLPRGVKPGHVNIKDMEVSQRSISPVVDENSQEARFPSVDITEPVLPIVSRQKKIEDDGERNSNSPHFFQNFMHQNNLDMLSSVMTSPMAPSTTGVGYQVENQNSQSMDVLPKPNPISLLPANININDLFQKLVATGIVATSTKEPEDSAADATAAVPKKRSAIESMKLVSFSRPETLKVRQSRLYEALYAGMQCSSCGMRFPPEQSIHYSQHLDWHFRQNRKGKKNIRVAASRRWYYSLSDWKNYEEIEDLEEREKNYFDQQQSQAEGAGKDSDDEMEIPSVPADADIQDAQCDVCQDKFDQFFNEEKEEWHLRNAVRVDDKTYHPVCYEDYQASLLAPQDETMAEEEPAAQEPAGEDPNIPGLEIILDDDEEEEEERKKKEEEEVVIEASDDSQSKPSVDDPKIDDEKAVDDDGDDDDVIINEVVPEKIEVDEDRDYETAAAEEVPIKIEQIDDGFVDVEEGLLKIKAGIKIKSEPVDPAGAVFGPVELKDVTHCDVTDDVAPQTAEKPAAKEPEEPKPMDPPTPSTGLILSMDGNTEQVARVPPAAANAIGKIKINISKPLPVIPPKETRDVPCDSITSLEPVIDPSQPLPPGEEPVQLNIKPTLRGVELKKMKPVCRGSELTGMCSIM